MSDNPWDKDGPNYSSAWDAADHGNLLSYAWKNRPGLDDLALPEVASASSEWPSWLGTAAKAASVPINLLTSPLRAGGQALSNWMEGKQGPETLHDITNATLGVGALGAGIEAPPGALRVFGGPSAKTADLEALDLAKRAAAQGLDARAIHEGTGWFQDVDGRWKFEIPDTNANLAPMRQNSPAEDYKNQSEPRYSSSGNLAVPSFTGKVKLGDVLEHPELYEAYPGAKDIPLSGVGFNFGVNGAYKDAASGGPAIYVGRLPPSEAVSTLLHETQHHIQDLEGFAEGGNTKQFLTEGHAQEVKATEAALDMHRAVLDSVGVNPYSLFNGIERIKNGQEPYPNHQTALRAASSVMSPDEINDFANTMRKKAELEKREELARDSYLHLAGEVESRNVQERWEQQVSPSVFPHDTQGYPTKSQIVKGARPEPEEDDYSWLLPPHSNDLTP